MARPKKDGLDYFSFDTDFFYADKRIRRLRSRYGSDGLIFYIYLLTEIYRNGYYIRWDEESIDDTIDCLNLTEGLIEQILEYLVSRSLLIRSTLANSVTTLSAPGIQKRYQEAVKSLKRDIIVDERIWLLNSEETASYIKVTHFDSFSEKNPSKSEKNHSKSEKNPTKEIKQKENKENENSIYNAEALFDSLWTLYPNKRGKGQVSLSAKQRLLKIGYDEMNRAIDRYKADLEKDSDWRKPQNGSTFFNSGYIDYLDANYTPSTNNPKKNKSTSFSNFEQRDYDFDELEKMLLDTHPNG